MVRAREERRRHRIRLSVGGDLVLASAGWQDYALSDGSDLLPLDADAATSLPPSLSLGALGMLSAARLDAARSQIASVRAAAEAEAAQLAAIAALRTLLNFFLQKEIDSFARRFPLKPLVVLPSSFHLHAADVARVFMARIEAAYVYARDPHSIEVLDESGHQVDVRELSRLARFALDRMRALPGPTARD